MQPLQQQPLPEYWKTENPKGTEEKEKETEKDKEKEKEKGSAKLGRMRRKREQTEDWRNSEKKTREIMALASLTHSFIL